MYTALQYAYSDHLEWTFSLYTLHTRIHAYYCVDGWLDIFLMVIYLTLGLKRQVTYSAVNAVNVFQDCVSLD